MSGSPFKQIPTMEQVAQRIVEIHVELKSFIDEQREQMQELELRVQANNELTDVVLEELQLKLSWLMNQIAIRKALHGGIAGPDGKVPFETKLASTVYQEQRATLVATREAVKRAQGLSPAEAPEGASPINGETRHDLIGDDDADPSETKH